MVIFTIPVKAEETSLQDIIAAGEIHIGTNAEYAPFETYIIETGEYEGFDIDIANWIAADLGVDIVWHNVAWDGILLGLETTYDIIISAMTITEEREEQCDFTRYYYQSYQAIMVRSCNQEISNMDDLNKTSVKVGYQTGTTSDIFAADHLISQKSGFEEITQAINALKVGNIDAMLGDKATLADAMKNSPGIFKLVGQFSPENFGIACKSGATSLVDRLNQIINGFLGTDLDNPVFNETYQGFYDAWFLSDEEIESYAGDTDEPCPEGIPGFPIASIAIIIPISVLVINKKLSRKIEKRI